MAINFSFSSQDNNHYATPIDRGSKFFIGRRVPYKDYVGLMNINTSVGFIYDPKTYEEKYGFWAYFISPTAKCESKGSY